MTNESKAIYANVISNTKHSKTWLIAFHCETMKQPVIVHVQSVINTLPGIILAH